MKRAVFLDRDGVINNPKRNYYVYRPADFCINNGVTQALKVLHERGYLLIVISNQGGISKGVYTKSDVEIVHKKMTEDLGKAGIILSAVYFCPHHPKKEKCLCRKPHPLMIEKAMARFEIDPFHSWFIGDRETDIEAGRQAGLNTLKIKKNGDIREVLKWIN